MLDELSAIKLPMVEIFQTVEGEGTSAGFPTTFVRVYNCNLRCTWCDTKYSYAPAKPEYYATIQEIIDQVKQFGNRHVCLTGGEPLMHRDKSLLLVKALSNVECLDDIHIETNGAIDLTPFAQFRAANANARAKVRFIMDYKLPASGETDKMVHSNFETLEAQDEIKFVIGDLNDFHYALGVLKKWHKSGLVLFSPVWETMPPSRLVELMLEHRLVDVKLNMQIHKVIWDPNRRGV